MLQSIRAMAHSWVVKALMLFLVVSFSIWGIGDIFRGNPQRKAVAKVGGAEITVAALNQLFEKTLVQARQSIDPNLTAAQAKQLGLLDRTLDMEIKRRLIDMDIGRLGVAVSPELVVQYLQEQSAFKDAKGQFDKQLFRRFLEQRRLSEQAFIADGQQQISREVLLAALGGAPLAPQTGIDALYAARAQKRVLEVVTIDAAKLGGIGTPEEKELHDFYQANGAQFGAPEYRSLTIASLSTESLLKDVSVSDEQLKKEYDARKDQLGRPERRDIVQVVVADEDKAQKIANAAKGSHDLNAAAKAAEESPVPMESVEATNLMPELSKAVFALHEGDVGMPVKSQLGWHVVQVKKIVPAGIPAFDKVKDKLREDVRHDMAIEAATRIVNQLDDQLAAGHSLDDIADGMKLRIVKIPSVDAKGLTPEGKAPAELPFKDIALKDAFGQNAGETSPVEDDKKGNYFVVRTEDVTPAGLRPFDDVEEKVAAAWKLDQQMKKAKTEAEKIARILGEGKPLASVSTEEGVSTRTSLPLSMLGEKDPALSGPVTMQAFKLKKGETASLADGEKEVVVRLSSIIDVAAGKNDPRKEQLGALFKKSMGDDLIDQYLAHLYKVFPVKTYPSVLQSMKPQEY